MFNFFLCCFFFLLLFLCWLRRPYVKPVSVIVKYPDENPVIGSIKPSKKNLRFFFDGRYNSIKLDNGLRLIYSSDQDAAWNFTAGDVSFYGPVIFCQTSRLGRIRSVKLSSKEISSIFKTKII